MKIDILFKQGQKVVHKNVSQGCNLSKRGNRAVKDVKMDVFCKIYKNLHS